MFNVLLSTTELYFQFINTTRSDVCRVVISILIGPRSNLVSVTDYELLSASIPARNC